MSSMTTRTFILGWLIASSCLLASGCGSVDSPVTNPKKPERERPPGPSEAICDPSACSLFCLRAACGTPMDACIAHCQAVCGDGYFDDRDGPVMSCTLASRTNEDSCAIMRTCCKRDYTSQLCDLSPSNGPLERTSPEQPDTNDAPQDSIGSEPGDVGPPANAIDAEGEIVDNARPEHL